MGNNALLGRNQLDHFAGKLYHKQLSYKLLQRNQRTRGQSKRNLDCSERYSNVNELRLIQGDRNLLNHFLDLKWSAVTKTFIDQIIDNYFLAEILQWKRTLLELLFKAQNLTISHSRETGSKCIHFNYSSPLSKKKQQIYLSFWVNLRIPK